MKKSICLMLAVVCLFSFCGCGALGTAAKPTPKPTQKRTYKGGLTREESRFLFALYCGTKDWDNLESIRVIEIYYIDAEVNHSSCAKIQYVDQNGGIVRRTYYIALQGNLHQEVGTMIISSSSDLTAKNEYDIDAINKQLQREYDYMLNHDSEKYYQNEN